MKRDIRREVAICIPTNGEKYDGEEYVCVNLQLNYLFNSYKITPPDITVETDCDFGIYVAKAIEEATNYAKIELWEK